MDYIFIVNPKSRTGQGELLWSQLEPELKKGGAPMKSE